MAKLCNSYKDACGLVDKACNDGLNIVERDALRKYITDLHGANHRMCTRLNALEPGGPNEDARA